MTDPLKCLRGATIVVAIWNIIYAVIQCGIMGWQIEVVKERMAYWENRELPATGAIDGFQARFPGLYAIHTETPERRRVNVMYAVVIVCIILSIAHFFFSLALLYGAIKQKHSYIWPWFFTAAPLIIMSTVYAVLWWSGDVFNEQLTMSVAEFVMSLALNGIAFVLVCFYFKRLSGYLESNRPARGCGDRVPISGTPPWRTKWSKKPPPELAKRIRRKQRERRLEDNKRRSKEEETRRKRGRGRRETIQSPPIALTSYMPGTARGKYSLPYTYDVSFPWRPPPPRTPPPQIQSNIKSRRSAAEIIENLYYEHYPEELPPKIGDLRRERHLVQR